MILISTTDWKSSRASSSNSARGPEMPAFCGMKCLAQNSPGNLG